MKKWFEEHYVYLIVGIMIAVIAIAIGGWIVALVKYGGKPISEIPAWALFYFIGNSKG